MCVGTVRLYLFWAVLLRRSVTVPGPLLPPFSAVRREIFPFLSPHSDNVYIVPIVMLTPGVGWGGGGSIFPPACCMSLAPFPLSDYAIVLYADIFTPSACASAIDSQYFTSHRSAFKLFLFVAILLLGTGFTALAGNPASSHCRLCLVCKRFRLAVRLRPGRLIWA